LVIVAKPGIGRDEEAGETRSERRNARAECEGEAAKRCGTLEVESFMQQEKRLWVALAALLGLAVLAWYTMDNTPIQLAGGHISFRGFTLVVLGFFAARTVLHWKAEKIRSENGSNEAQGSAGNGS